MQYELTDSLDSARVCPIVNSALFTLQPLNQQVYVCTGDFTSGRKPADSTLQRWSTAKTLTLSNCRQVFGVVYSLFSLRFAVFGLSNSLVRLDGNGSLSMIKTCFGFRNVDIWSARWLYLIKCNTCEQCYFKILLHARFLNGLGLVSFSFDVGCIKKEKYDIYLR